MLPGIGEGGWLEGLGVSECSGRLIFVFFFNNKNWMTRHHAERDSNIPLTRNEVKSSIYEIIRLFVG